MKKLIIILICILCILLSIAAVLPLLPSAYWDETPQGRRYMINWFRPVYGWQEIEGDPYYFDPQTGLLATGWLHLDEGSWFLDTDGHYAVGWQEIDGHRYYFTEEGIMATGLVQTDTGTYFLDEQGHMVTGWQESAEGKRYFDPSAGYMLTGWQDTPLGRRYFAEDGYMHTGWLQDGDGSLYLDENGAVCTGWLQLPDGTWLLDENGHPTTGWYSTETIRYYFAEDGKMCVGFHTVDGILRYFSADGNYVPLVNFANAVPDDYQHMLVTINDFKVDSTCAEPLKEMLAAVKKYGYTIKAAYRSNATQKAVWNKYYNQYLSQVQSAEEAKRLTARRVCAPGTSEHQLGLAVDISGSSALFTWLQTHSWEYGFIVRYDGDKEKFTGIMNEPWHFRYVGKDLAQHLYESDLCLEEFFMTAEK